MEMRKLATGNPSAIKIKGDCNVSKWLGSCPMIKLTNGAQTMKYLMHLVKT
jgi:hypothetical protein